MRILALSLTICLNLFCYGQSLTASLSACYNLNGHVNDAVNNLHGAVTYTNPTVNSVPPTVDRFNVPKSALNLQGALWSHIDFPDDPLIKPSNAITFSGWVRFSYFNLGINHVLFTRNNQSTNIEAYQLAVQSNSVGFYFNASKAGPFGVNTVTGTTQLTNLTWYHVAFTIDSNNIKLYLNGNLESSSPVTFPGFDYAPGKKVYLGATNEPSNNVPIAARVDNVRFYRRALTAAEINLLYTTDPFCNVPPQAPVCDDNTTYVLTDGAIYYYKNLNTFSAITPTVVDVVLPDSATGLAVAPSFSFTAPNPTFWTIGPLNNLYYFDGNNFVSSNHKAGPITELGGSKNFMYGFNNNTYKVYKYNGTGDASFLNTIYTFPNFGTTSDIVGDEVDYFHLMSYGSPKAMGYYNPSGVQTFTAWVLNNLVSSASGSGFAINDGTIIPMYSTTISLGVANPTLQGLFNFAVTPTIQRLVTDMASCYTKYSSYITASGTGSVSCTTSQVTLTCKSNQYFPSFVWSGPSIVSTAAAQAIVNMPGLYTCSVTNGLNYSIHTYTYLVGYTNSPLTISVTPATTVYCPPQSLALTASGATNYTWMPNISITSTNNAQVSVNPTANIVYTVTGTTIGTCIATKIISLTVANGPTVTASSTQSIICPWTNATLTASGAVTYTWNSAFATPTLQVSPGITTTYTLVGKDNNGCSDATSITQSVIVCTGLNENKSPALTKPFPNPTKDLLFVETDPTIKEMRFELFDLNGIQVQEGAIFQKGSIDLRNLIAGFYFMRLISNNGVYLHKIIKE